MMWLIETLFRIGSTLFILLLLFAIVVDYRRGGDK